MELRSGDCSKISSTIKSWLYADLLEKPEELVMYRHRSKGGLGVQHVKYKAMALLIRSFLETAINPKFIRNHYHHALYRWHVLGNTELYKPIDSPFYSKEFFSLIRQVSQEGLMNVMHMTTKQWYRMLVENNVLMKVKENNQQELIPTRCEIKMPDVDWDRVWSYTLIPGLDSEQRSFLFKMIHNILPTKTRLYRLQQADSPVCSLCTTGSSEDCVHAFLTCSYNTSDVNNWILQVVEKVAPNSSLQDIVTLDFNLDGTLTFPLIWFLSHILSMVWQLRSSKKTINMYIIRAFMEAKINILRKSRLNSRSDQIANMINLL